MGKKEVKVLMEIHSFNLVYGFSGADVADLGKPASQLHHLAVLVSTCTSLNSHFP